MDDRNIIALLFSRSEDGLQALEKKYGKSCRRIAEGILNDDRDAEECVNDAYLSLWSRIPPEKPESLSAYLFQTVRNIAVRRYRKNTAKKKGTVPMTLRWMNCRKSWLRRKMWKVKSLQMNWQSRSKHF